LGPILSLLTPCPLPFLYRDHVAGLLVGKVGKDGKLEASLGDCLVHFAVEEDGVLHICEV